MFRKNATFSPDTFSLMDRSEDTQHLEKIYYALKEDLDRELQITVKTCVEIFINELRVKFESASLLVKYALPECLTYYVKVWKGWQEIGATFEDFKVYLTAKIGFIIAHQETFCKTADKAERSEQSTEHIESPYNLVVYGSLTDTNNLYFRASNDNLVFEKHTAIEWEPLSVRELANFPYVDISVDLPFLKFNRRNSHQYKRYVSGKKAVIPCPTNHFISYIQKDNPQANDTLVYDTELVVTYFNHFLQTIRTMDDAVRQQTKIKVISELEGICHEFIQDLKDFSTEKNTLGVPYTIGFNIGRNFYVRCKSAETNGDNSANSEIVNYLEIIIPQVVFNLSHFEAQQEDTLFKSLSVIHNCSDEDKQRLVEQLNNSISYACRACSETFKGDGAFDKVTEHFRTKHQGELPVECHRCKEFIEVRQLLRTRWHHDCSGNNVK